MTVVDDARLLQLAAHRPKEVFSILERAASLSPLVFVLAIVPGIVALEAATLSERDAQWRLKGLELSTVPSIFDGVDPGAASTVSTLKFQPPLASWLLAAVDRWAPVDSNSVPLFEYLSAASLVPACFFCMSRLAGPRVGLISAALAAFHGTFLAQYRHSGPQALAVSAALFAFWGFFGHVWQASEIVSIDLLIGGLALGVCLLAGGPLALVVIAVLFVVSLMRIESSGDSRPGRIGRSGAAAARGRRLWSNWRAVRSLGVMTATAFAAGGWWELMMLYSYGREFGSAWLFATDSSSGVPPEAPLSSARFAREVFGEILPASGALAGLTVLGLWIVGRRMFGSSRVRARAEGESRGPLRFLAVWIVAAGAIFAASLTNGGSPSLYTGMWRLFFSAACVCMAAAALDEVLRRKVSLLEFVCLTLATLGGGYALLQTETLVPDASLRGAFIALAAALLLGRALQELCRRSELREWLLIAGLLTAFILGDAGLGLAGLERADADSQALVAFARSLAPDHLDAEACLLISESSPPARLQFALKSVWPKAQIFPVKDWDQALKIAAGDGKTPKTAVVVDWSRGNSRPANPTGARWNAPPIGNPQFFEQRPMRAYILVWELAVSETSQKIELLLPDATRRMLAVWDVKQRKIHNTSLMPTALAKTPDERRGLFAFLLFSTKSHLAGQRPFRA